MSHAFGPGDEGKQVTTVDGDIIGTVAWVSDGQAYIKPRSGLLDGCGSWITGSWTPKSQFRLDSEKVETVTEQEIVLEPVETRHRTINL